MIAAVAPGLTVLELAERLGRSERFADRLLEDLRTLGLARCARGRWMLSAGAERRYGPALRGIVLDREEGSS